MFDAALSYDLVKLKELFTRDPSLALCKKDDVSAGKTLQRLQYVTPDDRYIDVREYLKEAWKAAKAAPVEAAAEAERKRLADAAAAAAEAERKRLEAEAIAEKERQLAARHLRHKQERAAAAARGGPPVDADYEERVANKHQRRYNERQARRARGEFVPVPHQKEDDSPETPRAPAPVDEAAAPAEWIKVVAAAKEAADKEATPEGKKAKFARMIPAQGTREYALRRTLAILQYSDEEPALIQKAKLDLAEELRKKPSKGGRRRVLTFRRKPKSRSKNGRRPTRKSSVRRNR